MNTTPRKVPLGRSIGVQVARPVYMRLRDYAERRGVPMRVALDTIITAFLENKQP